MKFLVTHLVVTQFRECVDNDAEDDVKADCCDEHEVADVKHHLVNVVHKGIIGRCFQTLQLLTRSFYTLLPCTRTTKEVFSYKHHEILRRSTQ